MIDPGRYTARATSGTLGVSSKGNPQAVISFKILAADDADNERHVGRYITYYGPLTEAAREYTAPKLLTCGWNGTDWDTFEGVTDNDVSIVIGISSYNQQPEVSFINPVGSVAVKQPDAQQRAEFLADLRQWAKSTGLKPSAPRKPREAAEPPAGNQPPPIDDDIPF